jgi:hypothetical protein
MDNSHRAYITARLRQNVQRTLHGYSTRRFLWFLHPGGVEPHQQLDVSPDEYYTVGMKTEDKAVADACLTSTLQLRPRE